MLKISAFLFEALIFFVTFFYQEKKVNRVKLNNIKAFRIKPLMLKVYLINGLFLHVEIARLIFYKQNLTTFLFVISTLQFEQHWLLHPCVNYHLQSSSLRCLAGFHLFLFYQQRFRLFRVLLKASDKEN